MFYNTRFKAIFFLFFFSNILAFSQVANQSLQQPLFVESPVITFLEQTHKDVKNKNLPFYLDHRIISVASIPFASYTNIETRILTSNELKQIEEFKSLITSEFETSYFIGKSRHEQIMYSKIIPIRLNSSTNQYEFLQKYSIRWDFEGAKIDLSSNLLKKNATTSKANSSVLATGKWYKIGVTQTGIHKIDRAMLANLGIDVSTIDPRNIRVYGNGGKLMPEKNSEFVYDDLQENAISVIGENDGILNATDYILFYGQSTDSWKLKTNSVLHFDHQTHYFSDTSFYFITTDLGPGKRVLQQSSLSNAANKITSAQDYYGFHEQNLVNVAKSGREFFGEKFDFTTSYDYSFNVPDAVVSDSVYVFANVLSRSDITSSYAVNYNGGTFNLSCAPTVISDYVADIGYTGSGISGGLLNSPILSVSVTKLTSQATGWLDRIIFNCRRNIVFAQSQFNFRDRKVISGAGTYAQYLITNTNLTPPQIWDVTNPLEPKNQLYNTSGSTLEFTSTADSLKEFCAFISSQSYSPKMYGSILNQNIHAIQQADFIIVTHPLFLKHALRIAKLHQDYDTLTTAVVTIDQVYNEFSSGTPDIGAIKEFTKMLYKRPSDPKLATQYLLLFGDGSYKNKDINATGNSALIPTYETSNSTSLKNSFVTDDYFAMMDDSEGDLINNDIVDIGVGRFPVRSVIEAEAVTSKMEHYYKRNFSFDVNAIESSCLTAENDYSQGDWRNWVSFLADDEDSNGHENEADQLANKIYYKYKNYNVDKIYLDAYVQVSTPGGDRYPDVTNDLNRRIEKGALILNYTGHGGELGLTAERVVEVSQILGWKNKNNLPLMVTATCEFSRFDDPDRTSAGEYCLLNDNGGAIGLMTTVRLAFSNSNFTLNNAFFDTAFVPMANGRMPHIGDLYRLTKSTIGFTPQYMNFVILGDPALKLAYPEQRIYTSTINSKVLSASSSDTLKALAKMTVTGFVGDKYGNKLSTFNGVIYPTVFDKEININTLANDAGSFVRSFVTQKNSIYKGKSTVVNGDFSFSFLVPKDIAFEYGKGKISYYAHNGVHDAQGYYDKLVVGGFSSNPVVDNQGPAINLYMNDEKFISGGTTNESPKIYAVLSDSSGINTIGTGIGHDAVAILDANSSKPIILNDYYVANINTYQQGKIRYPLNELPDGNHSLSLRVWDVQNNSSTVYTDFVVAKQAELALSHILNYPNPFTTKTKFFIEHNQCCTTLKVLIQIYTISGKVVKSINNTITNEGFRFDGIEWDGKDEFGDKLARGVYIYKVSVTDNSSKKAEKIEKLVILN